MSNVGWIKLSTKMLDDEKIKLIRKMPNGYEIFYIWIGLMTQAGKCNINGFLMLSENIPYTEEMLAVLFDVPESSIRFALNTLEKFEMIERIEDVIAIINWEKHQNNEGLAQMRMLDRDRKRKQRAKQKLLVQEGSSEVQIGLKNGSNSVQIGSNGSNFGMINDTESVQMVQKSVQISNGKNSKMLLHQGLEEKSGSNGHGQVTDSHGTDIDKEKESNICSFGSNEPVSSSKEKNIEKEFETFWNEYPRKEGRKPSFEKFKSIRKKYSLETIMEGLKRYLFYIEKNRVEKQYIKHPKSFLNQEGFLEYNENPSSQTVIPKPKAFHVPIKEQVILDDGEW